MTMNILYLIVSTDKEEKTKDRLLHWKWNLLLFKYYSFQSSKYLNFQNKAMN